MTPKLLYRVAVGCYLLLFLLLVAWLTVLAPPPPRLIVASLLLLLVPLLLLLRGLLYARRYTMGASILLILFYFAHGVAAMASTGILAWLGALEIALSVGYFVATVGYIRATKVPKE